MPSTVQIPDILLPNENIDRSKWACIACDQFCAEPKYWAALDAYVGDAPSTLRLVLPEIYLKDNPAARISAIHDTMNQYVSSGIFSPYKGLILVAREVEDKKLRLGLMLAIDLEDYDWNRVRVPIRATEGTILSRLPARTEIRRSADIEFPHTLLLIDDAKKEIIEGLYAKREAMTKLYDFDLNMGGGHITGYAVPNPNEVVAKLYALCDSELQISKYGYDAGILFAVGDGNHSIAAAKTLWNDIKKDLSAEERETHPARFLLTEVVNVYGEGMTFRPIHRHLGGKDCNDFLRRLKSELSGSGSLTVFTANSADSVCVPDDAAEAIRLVQNSIERYISEGHDVTVEYVHSEQHLKEVLFANGGVGIIMPSFPKDELFKYVMNVGNLPKKAFSIGEPEHKRYYLEGRKITK